CWCSCLEYPCCVAAAHVLAREQRVLHPVEPAAAAVQGLLTEDALEAQADLLHHAAGGEVLGEAGGLDAAYAEPVEGDAEQRSGDLGAQPFALGRGVEDPTELGLLPGGPVPHVGLGTGVLPFDLADGDDGAFVQADHRRAEPGLPALAV